MYGIILNMGSMCTAETPPPPPFGLTYRSAKIDDISLWPPAWEFPFALDTWYNLSPSRRSMKTKEKLILQKAYWHEWECRRHLYLYAASCELHAIHVGKLSLNNKNGLQFCLPSAVLTLIQASSTLALWGRSNLQRLSNYGEVSRNFYLRLFS